MILQESKVEIVDEIKKESTDKQKNLNTKEPMGKKSVVIYISVFIGIIFLIFLIIFGAFSIYNLKHSDTITNGIFIYGIDISGLTKNEALDKLNETFSKIQNTEFKLYSGTKTNNDENSNYYETSIIPSEIDLTYDTKSAVNYAFSIGKNGNLFKDNYEILNTMLNGIEITPTYSVNEEELTKFLDNISKELPNAVEESSYYIEDSTLIITKGKSGFIVDSEKTLNSIKKKLANLTFLSSPTEISLKESAPQEINLEAIYQEVHQEASNAYYTTNPYAVYPSKNGVDFAVSLDEAKKELASSKNECKIKLKTIYPKVTTNMIGSEAFPNLLATFSTRYPTSNTNRTTNLRLAANKINGTVLLPGETFSYNKVVGERTIAAGYKEAAIYQNGQVIDGLGGGICQISTTLFNAALLANLDITEIHNHQFVPSYVGAGRDATVVYGAKDFQFKNSRKNAIKIKCSVSSGVATFKIYGVKENTEYNVSVNAVVTSSTSSAIKSSTYRILKLNGKTISKEKIYSCTYKVH